MNVASYDNYMLINSSLTFLFFAFFYDNLIAIRCMLQPISIRFTVLSCFATNIDQRVFSRGRTHANKAVTDRQTKFVNKQFITALSVRLI